MLAEYKKALRRSILFSMMWIILILFTGTASTYAWFSFTASTNVTPISGKISDGDIELLISDRVDGEFGTSAAIIPEMPTGTYTYTDPATGLPMTITGALEPVSTADLQNYYVDTYQKDEIVTGFKQAERPSEYYIHGTLYLKSAAGECNVFFDKDLLISTTAQELAALRMGMRITDGIDTETYIFSLEDMIPADQRGQVIAKDTVTQKNVVIAGLANGTASFTTDPSIPISSFISGNEGARSLFTLKHDVVTTVDFWIYLEGCDEHCLKEGSGQRVECMLVFNGSR